jgi:hypothetical protein
MDKSLLFARGGIREAKKVFADGQEHTFHYKAKTPNELAAHFGAINIAKEDADGMVAMQKELARFIAASLCEPDGSPFITPAEAERIPGSLKAELRNLILIGSNEAGDAGKG